MICKTEKQVSNCPEVAELLASSDDAAPVLGAEALKVRSHEDCGATLDNCAEHGGVPFALSKNAVKSVEPVDCQKPENKLEVIICLIAYRPSGCRPCGEILMLRKISGMVVSRPMLLNSSLQI